MRGRALTAVALLALLGLFAGQGIGTGHSKKGIRPMVLKISKASYFLGESIPAEIRFTNGGGKRLSREHPAKSLEVTVHFIDKKSGEDLNYTMGRLTSTIIDRAAGEYALVMPPKEKVEIEAGGTIDFTTDPDARLFLRTGRFDCLVRDHGADSNRVELAIQFTRESVDTLLALAADPAGDYSRREWAMDWLRKLRPEFRLKLSTPDHTAAVRAENETFNQPLIEKFKAWWKVHRDDPAIEAQLKAR